MEANDEKIILYTSQFCMHSRMVERFVQKHELAVQIVKIDGDPEARQQLIEINSGYASVPTLIFPDGSKLTEPSLSTLREKLGIEEETLGDKIRSLFRSENYD